MTTTLSDLQKARLVDALFDRISRASSPRSFIR